MISLLVRGLAVVVVLLVLLRVLLSQGAPAGHALLVADSISAEQAEFLLDFRYHPTSIGALDAPATLFIFHDYRCPHCKTLDSLLNALHTDPKTLRRVYLNYPTVDQDKSLDDAISVECAAIIGRFQWLHNELLRAQRPAEADEIVRREGKLRSDTVTLRLCKQQQWLKDHIQRVRELGLELEIAGVPTLIIGRTRIAGVPSAEQLRALLADG